MKKWVKPEDIKTIKYWADKGLSSKDIAEITGWSVATVTRARRGEEAFKKDREKNRIAQQKRIKRNEEVVATESVKEPKLTTEINDTLTEEVNDIMTETEWKTFFAHEEVNSCGEIVELLKVQNKLLSELIDLWR